LRFRVAALALPSMLTSFGEERPAAPGHDEDAWRQNRRSKLVVDNSD
jgi:outer membrane protein OmpA-like peptidoglycan-associated protein